VPRELNRRGSRSGAAYVPRDAEDRQRGCRGWVPTILLLNSRFQRATLVRPAHEVRPAPGGSGQHGRRHPAPAVARTKVAAPFATVASMAGYQ
jgi:hypothetical protein